jgi:RimJ/RimL family protein N-acetyltransferase
MLERLPEITALPGGYEAIGVERAGRLIGGCLFTEYVPYKGGGTITIWAAGERGWVSRRVIQTMLGYPFNQLGCHRITALAAKDNKPSRKLLEDLGFRFEGVARLGFGPRRHACIYGLLKIEQGWV